jgi:hypothetical protein
MAGGVAEGMANDSLAVCHLLLATCHMPYANFRMQFSVFPIAVCGLQLSVSA